MTPIHDLERRIDAIESRCDRNDAETRADLEAMRKDLARIRDDYVTLARFVPLERLFWAATTALVVAIIGGAVAILTRQ